MMKQDKTRFTLYANDLFRCIFNTSPSCIFMRIAQNTQFNILYINNCLFAPIRHRLRYVTKQFARCYHFLAFRLQIIYFAWINNDATRPNFFITSDAFFCYIDCAVVIPNFFSLRENFFDIFKMRALCVRVCVCVFCAKDERDSMRELCTWERAWWR